MIEPTPEMIEQKACELGFYGGWRFLTCAESRLGTAKMAIVTCNPGTDVVPDSHPNWSQEKGSAYADEAWSDYAVGQAPLQRQVQGLADIAGISIRDVASWHAVPFASKTEAEIISKPEAITYGVELSRWAFSRCPAKIVCSIGKGVPRRVVVESLGGMKHSERRVCAGWGSQTIEEWIQDGRHVIALPHLARFKLIGRRASEEVLCQVLRRNGSE